jgi:hypothetical protein
MSENVYVLEALTRIRLQELHAAAAHARLLAGLPARPTLARRALAAVLGVMRPGAQRSAPLALGRHPR